MRKIGYIAALMLLVLSCGKEPLVTVPSASGEEEIPVRLGYSLSERPLTPATRASIVGGQENTANYISSLKMLCFTAEGIYLGYREAKLEGDEQSLPDYQYNSDGTLKRDAGGHPVTVDHGCWGRFLFEGSVPARTARIHFVGNVTEDQVPGNDQLGGNENTLIRSARMSSTTANKAVAYWGFHGEASAEELQEWLSVRETTTEKDDWGQDVTVVTGYSKKEGSVVHLIRDRAWIHFGAMNDYDGYSSGGVTRHIDYKILTVDWIMVNGRDHGYLAPYNENNSEDHFAGYYDESAAGTADDPRLKTDRLTEYTRSDCGRFTAEESDMERVYVAPGFTPADGGLSTETDRKMFLFEEKNNLVERPKIILRVLYQKDKNSTAESNRVVKYHTLMLMDANNEPCQVYRNHKYVLNINGLPWEGLGYRTFDDAVRSVEYANNRTVSIDERVEEVNDGRFKLQISGGTSFLFSQPSDAGTSHTVTFHYEAVPDGGGSLAAIDISNFTATWTEPINESFAQETITVDSFDNTTGIGTFTYTLGTVIGSELQHGDIELHDKNSGLSRFVNIYTITQFDPAVGTLVKNGNRTIGDQTCDSYRMTFKVPKEYPADLYPIVLRIASTTLSPFRLQRTGNSDPVSTSASVSVESTENGASLDGYTLTGMDYVTSGNAWNYRAAGSPWNYWYTFTIINKPEQSGSVQSDDEYTLWLDDTRPLRAEANRADNVGLFLWIKYFGPATAVTASE